MPIRTRLVQAVNRETVGKAPQRVTHVCGQEPDGTRWHMSQAEAVRAIEEYELKLFTMVDNVPVPIVVVSRNGTRQLEILRAAGRTGNLLELPECTWSPAYKPAPAAAAAAAVPGTPVVPAGPTAPKIPDRRSAHATTRIIDSISAPDPWDHDERIARIGGRNRDGTTWEMTVDEAIRAIDRFEYSFYVKVNRTLVPIIVATRPSGKPFLKSRTDTEASETLLALPATLGTAEPGAPDPVPPREVDLDSGTPFVEGLTAISDRLSSLQRRAEDRVSESELAQLTALAQDLRDQASALLRHEPLSARSQLLVRLRLSIAISIEEELARLAKTGMHRSGHSVSRCYR
jgi:hypothetical protein